MNQSADSIFLKLRPDLQWSRYGLASESEAEASWVACDPIALEYYYFSAIEKKILQLLDGTRSLANVLETEAGRKVGQPWLTSLIVRAKAACLLVSHQTTGQSQTIWQQSRMVRRNNRLQWLLSPLAFRVRLFDPTPLLNWLSPIANILFSRPLRWLLAVAGPLVLLLVIVQLITNETASSIFLHLSSSSGQFLVLMIVYSILKSLHELGHALACQKWRAQCHEIGIMFLVFAPCLYCDTSDSWKISDHRSRAWIAAAGIYVELIIAMVAACIWMVTSPTGQLHWIAAYTMIVGSISTVAVNANPLLRYDGYYLFCDLFRIPNLAEQSREGFESTIVSFFTGAPIWRERWDKPLWFLLTYELLARIYRTFLLVVIVGFVWITMNHLGLRLVAVAVTLTVAVTVIFTTLRSVFGMAKRVVVAGRMRFLRSLILFLGLGVGLWSIMNIQWSTYTHTRSISELSHVVPVYARQNGHLSHFAAPGAIIQPGDEVARLSSPYLNYQLIEAQGDMLQAKERLQHLRISQVDNPEAGAEIGAAEEQLVALEAQLQYLQNEMDSLTIRAAIGGKFVWDQAQSTPAITEAENLNRWQPLLTTPNLNCLVERSTLLGWIAVVDKVHLSAIVSEQDAKIIHPGASCICRWDCNSAVSYEGTVTQIGAEPIEDIPSTLAGDYSFSSYLGFGSQALQQRFYEVKIHVKQWPAEAANHSLATVHVFTGKRTLFQSLQRYFSLNIQPIFQNEKIK